MSLRTGTDNRLSHEINVAAGAKVERPPNACLPLIAVLRNLIAFGPDQLQQC
jgi:hypothetical protein